MTTEAQQQIAREAALEMPGIGKEFYAQLERIILSAIERATDVVTNERNGLSNALQKLMKAVNTQMLCGVPEINTVDDMIIAMRNISKKLMDVAQPQRNEQQEWTHETVRQFWRENQKKELMDDEQWNTFFQSVADAHNAALTVEYVKGWKEGISGIPKDATQPDSNTPDEITQLRQELTAERQRSERMFMQLRTCYAIAIGKEKQHSDYQKGGAWDSESAAAVRQLYHQLLSAQAAIEEHNKFAVTHKIVVDLSDLHKHDAAKQAEIDEARAQRNWLIKEWKPLVEALEKLIAMDFPDFGRKLISGEVHDVASKDLNL